MKPTSWAAVLLAVLTAASASGCHPSTDRASEQRPSAAEPSTTSAWCEARSEPVECIEGPDGLQAIVLRGDPQTTTAVLWDPGGPGLGLPDADTPFSLVLPRAIRDRNVVMVVEPWVRRPPSRRCLQSSAAGAVPRSCRLVELTTSDASILAAARHAERRAGLTLVGAYLQSFGATRTLPVLQRHPGRTAWIVLESPGPPPGTSAARLLRARGAAAVAVLQRGCPTDRCRTTIEQHVSRLARSGVRGTISGPELSLGVIALATLPDDNAELVARLHHTLQTVRVSPRLLKEVKLVGRLYSGAGPRPGITGAQVGLWSDTCPRLTEWDKVFASHDPLVNGFAYVFRGCRTATPHRFRPSHPVVLPRTLMLTGRHDAIVPPHLQSLWMNQGLSPTRVVGSSHFWESDATTERIRRWIDETPPSERHPS